MKVRVRVKGLWVAATALALLPAVAFGAGSPDCNRACLNAIAEQYLRAMPAHDPANAPLSPEVRYTENGVQLTLPDGLWRTASSIGKYRLYVDDPQQGEVGFFAKARENGAPVLLATRLKIVDHKITQIESIVVRLSDMFGGHPRPDVLGDAPRSQFLQVIPPADRRSRQQLIDIATSYWTGIENNTGSHPPPFADDCNRIEDGSYTTNRPLRPGAKPNSANYSCKKAFALGYYHEDTRLRDRRILAIDPERGLVYTSVEFDHDATVRSYTLKNGQVVRVTHTSPWTWMMHEIFKVNREGKISQVEAILLSVPYGMRPGWHTGILVPDGQAMRDHFRE
jgi:hypothetical protein